MANPGKNKLLRYARLYLDGYDLSGDSRTLSSLDYSATELDFTGWDNSIRQFLSDQFILTGIRGYQAFINDASDKSFDALTPLPSSVVYVSMLFGGNAEPETGDPAYLLPSAQMGDQASFDGGVGVLSTDFLPISGGMDIPPWGYVLYPKTTVSANDTGDTLDDFGAGSTAGYIAILHVLTATSGSIVFTVEHSTDDNSYSTLGTFIVLDGSVIGGEMIEGSSTVNRYIQFEAVWTSGSAIVACTFIRKK